MGLLQSPQILRTTLVSLLAVARIRTPALPDPLLVQLNPAHTNTIIPRSQHDALLQPGLPAPGDRDAHLLRPYRPSSLHMAPQALHLHLGEPHNSKTAIWHEDYLHLHPDSVH